MRYVRLTDYYSQLDTLTVAEELVRDADLFLKLMSYATNNQAFQNCCQFDLRLNGFGGSGASYLGVGGGLSSSGSSSSSYASSPLTSGIIESPAWFKPKSFHTLPTWVIVALEENLWAQ